MKKIILGLCLSAGLGSVALATPPPQPDQFHAGVDYNPGSGLQQYGDLGNFTSGGAASQYYGGLYYFSATDNQVIMHFVGTSDFSSFAFNGPVVTLLSGNPFTSVTIDAASDVTGFNASRFSFNSSSFQANLAGLEASIGSQIVFDFSPGSVPEPASLALAGLGAAGLLAFRRKK